MTRRTFLLAALAILVLATYLLFRPATLPSGLIPEDGVYDARILRDTWGVPHVFGRTARVASKWGERGGASGEMTAPGRCRA